MFGVLPVRWVARLKHGGVANQFVMATMVTIPALNFGMLMGWQSPMTPILQSPTGPAPEPISDETISWMAAITFMPPIFCGFMVGDLADRWGRKITTLLTALMLVLSWTITLFSLRPWALISSRAVAGLACAGCYVVIPLYLKEIASDNIRGALGSLFILSQNLGYLVVYVAGDLLSFDTVLWLCTAVPAIFLVAFIAMPETPVFLVKQGKIKEARAALAWLRNTTTDDKDLEEAIQQLEREEEYARSMKKATWKSIVKDKTTFKAFRISLNVMLSQETCGYLVVLMYAGSIFEQASESISLKLSPNKQTIVVGVIQLLGSIVASCIVEQTGRKWLLAGTSLATGLSMLALGTWFYITSLNIWLPGWLPVLAMCLCIFADAAGYQPVPYVITSELFTFQHRGMVTSFVSSVDALSDFLQTKAYDPLLKLLGIHWVFIMFSIVCFLGTFYTVMWVPETKDKTVEEIYAILEDSRKKEKRKGMKDLRKEMQDLECGKEMSRL
ncbi:solute carrier family 2, facilitated glucose transporter member 8-like [Spodoptera frugiperda]|uniref:Solute carrier family 2, facilitated glucose transporter member 8-like n=1 Tax=Spodoptera frugiperda TaxID=7108 RepID=A0A9R0DGF4_SPOFR|nr:solute carrier family 2, facilitated glucose transporter member 8-like [Spodoptera frugiperda]XP_035452560.2 solute carrier family 2, facilitated glucose transporter member 8-like [Spodoptera frugiperda]